MDLNKIIEKYRLNKSEIARKIGMSTGHFNNALRGNVTTQKAKFTIAQRNALHNYFEGLSSDIKETVKSLWI